MDGKLVAATVLFPTFLSHAALPGALLRGRQPWAGGSACHLCGPRSGRDELAGYCGLWAHWKISLRVWWRNKHIRDLRLVSWPPGLSVVYKKGEGT